MVLKNRVVEILNQNFSPAEINIGRAAGAKRIAGYIVSDAFAGLDDLSRQQQLRCVLRQELGEAAQSVSTILIYTTTEYKVMTEA